MKELSKDFFKFAVIGLLATVVHVTIALLLNSVMHVPVQLANSIAFLCAITCSYVGNKQWTFRSDLPHKDAFPKFLVMSVIGYGINLLIVFVVVDLLKKPFWAALLLIVTIIPILNFFIAKKLVFSPK